MKYSFQGNVVVIALGGSVVYPEGIDTKFIARFKKFALGLIKRNNTKFVIVIGGGKLARFFQSAAAEVTKVDNTDKDWIGIHATRLNAHLLRTVFKDVADPVVIDERHKIKKPTYPITFASGWKPGWSTDYIAMQLAEDFGTKEAIIAGKPDHVYDRDPSLPVGRRTPPAKPLPELDWKAYRKLVPKKWTPGLSAPVDPVAAALGDKKGIKAIIVNGKDLKNFKALLEDKEFKGSVIG